MIRNLMTLCALVVCSSCAWRGETKFVARHTTVPPETASVTTESWAVDLDAKQLTFDTGEPKTLTDAQVASVKSALGALVPAAKEFCEQPGNIRTLELADGQTRYAEGSHACTANTQGTYLYVESLEEVFVQLVKIAQ